MKRIGWFRPLVLALGTAALGACTEMQEDGLTPPDRQEQQTNVAAQGQDLFTIPQVRVLSMSQQARLATIADRPAAVGAAVAYISGRADDLLQAGVTVGLPVSATERLVARGNFASQEPAGQTFWSGELQNGGGSVELIFSENGITGHVQTRDNVYWIEPMANGMHAIVRLDRRAFPVREDDTPDKVGSLLGDLQLGVLAGRPRIRVTTAYTAAVKSRHASMCDYVALIRGSINNSYRKSGFDDKIVVDAYCGSLHQVNYSGTSGGCREHLSAMTAGADGKMDGIKRERLVNESDVVILLVTDQSCGGLADAIRADFNSGYAVVRDNLAVSRYGFAHELGHLQGARHDREVDDLNYPYKFGHGFVDPDHHWRTIMAYDDACGNSFCPAIQYWSNPNKFRDGQRMGSTTYENNARVLRTTASRMGGLWREMGLRIEGPRSLSGREFGRCTWTAVVTAGATPKTFQWSGIFSGGGAVKIARLTRGGEATVRVRDAAGQTLTETIHISVDPENPDNTSCKK